MMLDGCPDPRVYPDPRDFKYIYYKRKYQAFYELCETFARENGRLRKLVREACSCIERFCAKCGCDDCPLLYDEWEPCGYAPVLADARDLKVEVRASDQL